MSAHTPGPCPFCGKDGVHRFAKNAGLHWVACSGCEAEGPAIYDYEQAIAAWNSRAELDALKEQHKAALRAGIVYTKQLDALSARVTQLEGALTEACKALDHLAFNIGREDGEGMTQVGAAHFAEKSYERVCAAIAGAV